MISATMLTSKSFRLLSCRRLCLPYPGRCTRTCSLVGRSTYGATRAEGGSPVDTGARNSSCDEMRNTVIEQFPGDDARERRHRCVPSLRLGDNPDLIIVRWEWAGVRVGFCHVALSLTSLSWNVEQDWIEPDGTSCNSFQEQEWRMSGELWRRITSFRL